MATSEHVDCFGSPRPSVRAIYSLPLTVWSFTPGHHITETKSDIYRGICPCRLFRFISVHRRVKASRDRTTTRTSSRIYWKFSISRSSEPTREKPVYKNFLPSGETESPRQIRPPIFVSCVVFPVVRSRNASG